MSRVLILPHSSDEKALEATAATLLALHPPGAHVALRDPDGKLLLDSDGRLTVESHDPDFLVFAVRRQGYGRDAKKAEDGDLK